MNCTGYPDWFDEIPELKEVCPFDFKCDNCDYDCEVNTNDL